MAIQECAPRARGFDEQLLGCASAALAEVQRRRQCHKADTRRRTAEGENSHDGIVQNRLDPAGQRYGYRLRVPEKLGKSFKLE